MSDGSNTLVGEDPDRIVAEAMRILRGNGKLAVVIADAEGRFDPADHRDRGGRTVLLVQAWTQAISRSAIRVLSAKCSGLPLARPSSAAPQATVLLQTALRAPILLPS